LFDQADSAIATYTSSAGSSGTGSFYSFGSSGSSERALGGVGSGGVYFGSPSVGAVAGCIAVEFRNASGGTLNSFTASFVGEQWRNGGNTAAQTMRLEYGFGPTFAGVGLWTAPGGTFDYSSPVIGSSSSSVDGNTAGKVLGLGGTISSLAWNNGDTLWIRWVENNDPGSDHGLAIDDFTFTATAVPEPSTLLAGALLALPFGVQGVRYLRNRKRA